MTNIIKTLSLSCMAIIFAGTANAAIVPVHEYNTSVTGQMVQPPSVSLSCRADCYEGTAPGESSCDIEYAGSKTCYCNCRCNAAFIHSCNDVTDENGSGATVDIEGDSTPCTLGGGAKYTHCKCGNGFEKVENHNLNSEVFNYKIGTTDDGTQCVTKETGWTCKSNYTDITGNKDSFVKATSPDSTGKFTFNMSGEYTAIKYTAYANKKTVADSTLICIKSDGSEITISTPLYTSEPTNITCVTKASDKDALLGKKTYYYYSGCSSTGRCDANLRKCGKIASQDYTKADGTPGTCSYVGGCDGTKSGTDYICVEKNQTIDDAFSYSTEDFGSNIICKHITGCTNGYTVYDKINAGSSTSAIETAAANSGSDCSDSSVYTTNKFFNSNAYLICRKPSGCKTSCNYCDTSCDSNAAWGGKLGWFF